MEHASLTAACSEEKVLIDARQFFQHDPLLMLLKEKLRIQDHWTLLGSAVLPAVGFSCWGIWLAFSPTGNKPLWTLNNTVSSVLLVGIVFPLLFLIYLRLPGWLADLFNQLYANEVIGPHRGGSFSPASYQRFVHLLTDWMDKWWWSVGALALIVLYLGYRIPVIELPQATHIPLWLRCLDLIIFVPLMYATFLSIARMVVAFVAINWLLWIFTIQVKPLHPDGSGGLRPVGRLMWLSVLLLLWDALLLYTGLISRNVSVFSSFEISLLGVIYLTLIPFVLIGWLLVPHLVMLKARDAYLQPLASELYALLSQARLVSDEDTQTMKATTDRLLELERRFAFVRSTFPTWPLESLAFGRLVAVVILSPLVPLVLPWLLALISRL